MDNELDSHVRAYEGKQLYDFDNKIQLSWYPKRILELAPAAGSILELGLGHGIAADIFSGKFRRQVVLDGSPAVIGNFRKRYPGCGAEIVETVFESFTTGEKFDLIVMGYVLEHVENPAAILRRFREFLAPGGKVFAAVPNAEVLNRRLGHLAGLLPDLTQLSEHDRLLGHKRYYTVKTLTEEARCAGYKVERLEGIYLKPFTTKQIISLELDGAVIGALCAAGVAYPELSCGILAQLSPL